MSSPSARLQLIPGDVPPADRPLTPAKAGGAAETLPPPPELFDLVRAMARADVAAAWARQGAEASAATHANRVRRRR